jgi:hypothetical protein
MACKAHNSSAEIRIRTWARLAGPVGCVLAALAFAGDASAGLPSVAALTDTATQARQSAPGALAPVSESAAGAATAERKSATPIAGATSDAIESVQSVAGPVAEGAKAIAYAPSSDAAGAGSALAPGVRAVEHAVARAAGVTQAVSASTESAAKALRPLVAQSSQSAGALLTAASTASRGLGSAVSEAGSASRSALRPAVAAIAGSPAPLAPVGLPIRPGRVLRSSPNAEHSGGGSVQSPAARAAPLMPAAFGDRPDLHGGPPASALADGSLASPPLIAPSSPFAADVEGAEGLGAAQSGLQSSLFPLQPGPSGAAHRSIGPTREARSARASASWRPAFGRAPVPMPSGVPGSAAGAFGVAFLVLLTLAGLLLLGVPSAIRRLQLAAEPRLATAFALIPERPG